MSQPMQFHPVFAPKITVALSEFLVDPWSTDLLSNAFQRHMSLTARFAWKLAGSRFGDSMIIW